MILKDFLQHIDSFISVHDLFFEEAKNQNEIKNIRSFMSHLSIEASLKIDSRTILPGDVFLSLDMLDLNLKRKYIEESYNKGAIFSISGPSSRLLWTKWAKAYYPKQPKYCVGVTGTSGKSSIVNFTRQLWEMADLKAASIGTLGLYSKSVDLNEFPEVTLTSPDAMILHSCLNKLVENEINYVALEISSHGLAQYRLDKIDFQAAAFINLSHEHLDYHGTIQSYFQAKSRLFDELLPPGCTAIINQDDPYGQEIIKICQARGHSILGFGFHGHDLKLIHAKACKEGLILNLEIFGKKIQLKVSLIGNFQAYNILAALGLALATGLDVDQALESLSSLKTVSGRMEFIGKSPTGGRIFVDYAHKPQALEHVLKAVRAHSCGKIITVFGCGGNRDTAKRFMMGKIAQENSDIVIVTDDNPRFENPDLIRAEILRGCPKAQEIPQRNEAIAKALEQLHPEDICIIAGKGHEQGQIVGNNILPFNDKEVVLSLIN